MTSASIIRQIVKQKNSGMLLPTFIQEARKSGFKHLVKGYNNYGNWSYTSCYVLVDNVAYEVKRTSSTQNSPVRVVRFDGWNSCSDKDAVSTFEKLFKDWGIQTYIKQCRKCGMQEERNLYPKQKFTSSPFCKTCSKI